MSSLYLRRYTVFKANGLLYPNALCIVPKELLHQGELNTERYITQGWAARNCMANHTVGSHLFPNLAKPISFAQLNRKQRAFIRGILRSARTANTLKDHDKSTVKSVT